MKSNKKSNSQGKIIPLVEEQIPTIVSIDPVTGKYIIGKDARKISLKGKTNVYNFKPALWENSSAKIKDPILKYAKRPYWIRVSKDDEVAETKTFNALEATKLFLESIFTRIGEKPDQIVIGKPAIRDEKLRKNFRENMREVLKELGIRNAPKFFPEPFAVYQYYALIERLFPKQKEPQLVLIVDIGGGTFNSCIIKTTELGHLSKGGATKLPIGLQAAFFGGNKVDEELLKTIIRKVEKNLTLKEDLLERARTKERTVFMIIEDAKIELSKKLADYSYFDSIENISTSIKFEKGVLHQDEEISSKLTANDLKAVIRQMWRHEWSETLNKTIVEAEEKLNRQVQKIDRVIVAGGSSQLPFMRDLLANCFPTLINTEDIFIGEKIGEAVSYGIAAECMEEARKDSSLKIDKIATCCLSDLYLGLRKHRKDQHIIPKLRKNGKEISTGQLLSSPFEIESLELEFEGKLPFLVENKLFYTFSDSAILENEYVSSLNVGLDVCQIPGKGKLREKFRLILKVAKDGRSTPTFYFIRKGKEAKKGEIEVKCPAFQLVDFSLEEGNSFIGIDFGTSNTYITKFISTKREEQPTIDFPNYTIKKLIKEKLRKHESDLRELRKQNFFTKEKLIRYAKKQKLLMVFHSNKIEGNPLTIGETDAVTKEEGSKIVSDVEIEARNLYQAYEWSIENPEEYLKSPESFFRELNKIILKGLNKGAGMFRSKSVKLSGMKFVPPEPNSVSSFVKILSDEIKSGPEDRSIIEFAASIHAKFVSIHPFVDGNGRGGRLLMNAILLANQLPVVLINYEDRSRYLDSLEEANQTGDITNFVSFILECFENSMNDLSDTGSKLKIEIEKETEISKAVDTIKSEESLERPLQLFMQNRIKTQRKKTENNYNAYKNGLLLLATEIQTLIENFNNNVEYTEYGYSMFFKNYDMISMEKYHALANEKRASQTWFIMLGVNWRTFTERILCFFQTPSRAFKTLNSNLEVTLALARYDGESYNRLINEPISIREIGYSDGQILFFCNDGQILEGHVRFMIEKLLVELIENYFVE
jgi:Fic family protein